MPEPANRFTHSFGSWRGLYQMTGDVGPPGNGTEAETPETLKLCNTEVTRGDDLRTVESGFPVKAYKNAGDLRGGNDCRISLPLRVVES